jgi:predicted esterase
LGGAVVIQAAAAAASSSDIVSTVVTLSAQCYGAESVSRMKQGNLILLIHGTDDKVLPPYCSSYVYNLANDPKEIIFYKFFIKELGIVLMKQLKRFIQWYMIGS